MNEIINLYSKIIIQIKSKNIYYNIDSPYWKMVDEIDIKYFCEFIQYCLEKKCSWSYIKTTVETYLEWNQQFHWVNYMTLVDMFPYEGVSDSNELTTICMKVIEDNAKIVADYKGGKKGAINSLKGQIMKQTKGKADMNIIAGILEDLLK